MKIPDLKMAKINLVDALVNGGDVDFHYALAVLSLRQANVLSEVGDYDELAIQYQALASAIAICRQIPPSTYQGLGGLMRPLEERRYSGQPEHTCVKQFLLQNQEAERALEGRERVKRHAQRLNELERIPDGDDYNEILAMLQIPPK